MTDRNTDRPARLAPAQKRILALVAERPGLTFSFSYVSRRVQSYNDGVVEWAPSTSYYSIYDNGDNLYESRTSMAALHGLIDAGLLPLAVLVATIGTKWSNSHGGLSSDKLANEILAQAAACSDYLTMTPAEIRAAIDAGRLGYDEDGQLATRCTSCGNTSPDYSSPCSCH